MKKNAATIILIASICIIGICVLIIGYKLLSDWPRHDRENEIVQDDDNDDKDRKKHDRKKDDKEPETQTILTDLETEYLIEQAIMLAMAESDEADISKALELFEQAASQGNSDAQYFAGEMYLQGIGADADTEKAADYIQQAFEQGNKKSFDIYAKLCFMGEGAVLQDYEKSAAIFYLLSGESAEAAYMLGLMHTFGMGVPIAFDIAEEYLTVAQDEGYESAAAFHEAMKKWNTGAKSEEWGYSDLEIVITNIEYDSDLNDLIEEYAHTLAQSEHYETFIQEKAAIENMDISVTSNITLFGKENWLFMQSSVDGSAYHDYIGDNTFTNEEMASIASKLVKQKEAVEAEGAEFVLLIIPNKEVIYADKMPTYIERVSEETRTDKLVAYLRDNTDLEIVYLKEAFENYKDRYQLYYKTDSHCNMQGSYVAVSELLNAQYGKQFTLDNIRFDIHMKDYCGDLGVMLGRNDRYSIDSVYFLPSAVVHEEDKVDASLMLIGDSFSEFINTQSTYFFNGGVEHLMIMDYNYDFYKATKSALTGTNSDLVVWECAERYIDRLK